MTTVVLLSIIAIALTYVIVFYARSVSEFQKRWEGAFRHIITLLFAWSGLAILAGISVMIDLFEKDLFSLHTFIDALKIPILFFVGGLVVILISLYVSIGFSVRKKS